MGNTLLQFLFWSGLLHVYSEKEIFQIPDVKDKVENIARVLSSSYPNQTLVFVLRMEQQVKESFVYLWHFPNSHLYLAEDSFMMKPNDREIVISWERDEPEQAMAGLWVLGTCGHQKCDDTTQNLVNLRLDRRVLIQIRELSRTDFHSTPALRRETLDGHLWWKAYWKYYRSTFVLLRLINDDKFHSAHQIKRTGRVVGNSVMDLEIIDIKLAHVKKVFDNLQNTSNQTAKFTLGFFGIFFLDGTYNDRFMISSCRQNEKIFVHAYTYMPVRLAVPLKWTTRIVSNLPGLIILELPLTLVCLFALPVIVSAYHQRSVLPTSSMWKSALHLLSGNCHDSMISPAQQGTFLLLICGLVSLLIQFPINLLKGEVVSSTQVQRIRHSNCTVLSCTSTAYREPWLQKNPTSNGINIFRMHRETHPQVRVRGDNLERGCSNDSINSSGMMNWTKLALLLQYETICDEPELMKLQTIEFDNQLIFENIPGSHATQPLCSIGTNHGGHVKYWEHLRTANQILEHSLLKYHHVNTSLKFKNLFEQRFWNNFDTKPAWGNSALLKSQIWRATKKLYEGYNKFNMFERSGKMQEYSSSFRELLVILVVFSVAFLAALVVFYVECLLVVQETLSALKKFSFIACFTRRNE